MELEKYNYTGCGKCPLANPRGDCIKNHRIHLKVKITKAISWEAWGAFINVFNVGDIINGEGVAKDGTLYCFGAESPLHPEVKDYIPLNAIEIQEVTEHEP